MIGKRNFSLLVRLVLGAVLLLLMLWGTANDSADSKEPRNHAARPLHRTAVNVSPR